jgi:LmbE family N-acetylglucosaminyl deacetylase
LNALEKIVSKLLITEKISQLYRRILINKCSEYEQSDLSRSAIVFSPHFDDETLGCGGIIFKKKRAGADLKIVFMTDGSKSHKDLILEEEIKAIRKNEGLACAQSLGLSKDDVLYLDLEEQKLNELEDYAISKVKNIIFEQNPEEIFIPYSKEPLLWSEDHLATTRIVKSALQSYPKNVTIYEYPVWFWFHWPWVELLTREEPDWLRSIIFKNTISYGFGLRLLQDFRCSVYIGDCLNDKYTALAQHKSQMTRLIPDSNWSTLNDVSNGEFLKCFFQAHEIFRRYHHLGNYFLK